MTAAPIPTAMGLGGPPERFTPMRQRFLCTFDVRHRSPHWTSSREGTFTGLLAILEFGPDPTFGPFGNMPAINSALESHCVKTMGHEVEVIACVARVLVPWPDEVLPDDPPLRTLSASNGDWVEDSGQIPLIEVE